MGIVAAIARVRAGAKNAGLEGVLNSLGAELKSDAIPERLRDVAGRLAALLDRSQTEGVAGVAVAAPVASLEVALDQHAALRAAAEPGAVCPFTGARADESAAPASTEPESAPASTEPERAEMNFSPAVPVVTSVAATSAAAERTPSAPAEVSPPVVMAPAEHVAVEAPQKREEPAPQQEAGSDSHAASASAKRPREGAATATREKGKERLAGGSSVANTSGRSATRPAAKRPRSRAEGSRKKK